MIVANFTGDEVEEVTIPVSEVRSKEFKEKSPFNTVPVFECEKGTLFDSEAIALHLAHEKVKLGLLGADMWQSAQIRQWNAIFSSTIGPLVHSSVGPILGWAEFSHEGHHSHSQKKLKEQLRTVDAFLKGKQFFVGDKVTVADIHAACVLLLPFQLILDAGFRKAVPELSRWFEQTVALPEFQKRWGKVKLAKKPFKANFPKEEPKKQAKKEEPKKKEEKTEEPKKEVNPLDALPPSKFDLNAFKDFFLNIADKEGEGMTKFWQDYDAEGYSIWYLQYEKYEGEGEKLYMTNNLCNGFLQRIDHFRKHVFARHAVIGDEPSLEIEGVWMFRGLEVPFEMKDHPQFEYYKSRKLDITNEEDRKLISEFWTVKADGKVRGLTYQEGKYHK